MNQTIKRKTLITNIFAFFSGTAFAQIALALSLFLTARILGADGFGQYAACFAITKLSAVLFNLGLDTWLLRESRRGLSPLGELVGSILIIKSTLGIIWLMVILFVSHLLDKQTYPSQLLFIAAVTTWLEAVFNTSIFAFNSAMRNQVTALFTIISSSSLLAITIVLMMSNQNSTLVFAKARLIIAIIATVGALLWFARAFKLSSNQLTIRWMMREIAPYTLSEGMHLIYTQADITIIAFFLGTKATGIYSIASSIVRALYVVPQAIHTVMLPVLSQLLAQKDRILEKTFQLMVIAQAGIGTVLWLLFGLFGPILVWLILGNEFSGSGNLVKILSAILFIKSCSHGMAAMIVAVGYQKYRVIIQGITAALNVALNIWMVNQFGVTGVAWVYVISELILLLGYIYLVQRWRSKTYGRMTPAS